MGETARKMHLGMIRMVRPLLGIFCGGHRLSAGLGASWEWCSASKVTSVSHVLLSIMTGPGHNPSDPTTDCTTGITPIPSMAPLCLGCGSWWSPSLTVPLQSSSPFHPCSCTALEAIKKMLMVVFHSLLLCIHTGPRFSCFLANIFLYNSEIFILSNKRQ